MTTPVRYAEHRQTTGRRDAGSLPAQQPGDRWLTHSRLRRAGHLTALTAAAVVLAASGAIAHTAEVHDGAIENAKAAHGHDENQHGGAAGHLAPKDDPNDGLELISRLTLKNVEPGKTADVGVLKNHAYLAAWGGQSCTYNGVHVVDISDVTAPKEVAFIHSKEGSDPGEGVQALPISTAAFTGDILVTNNEICTSDAGDTYAVPEAHDPVFADGFGDLSVHEVATSAARSDVSYISYYAAGLRVVDINVDRKGVPRMNEVAAFIDRGGNNFWGVEVFTSGGREYVAASDRDVACTASSTSR